MICTCISAAAAKGGTRHHFNWTNWM